MKALIFGSLLVLASASAFADDPVPPAPSPPAQASPQDIAARAFFRMALEREQLFEKIQQLEQAKSTK